MDFDIIIDNALFKVYAIKCKVKDFFGKRFIKDYQESMYRDTLKSALKAFNHDK